MRLRNNKSTSATNEDTTVSRHGAKKSRTSAPTPAKKKGHSDWDDDSSVDSKGNIRGLIDYDYDTSDSERAEIERRAQRRKQAQKQRKEQPAVKRRRVSEIENAMGRCMIADSQPVQRRIVPTPVSKPRLRRLSAMEDTESEDEDEDMESEYSESEYEEDSDYEESDSEYEETEESEYDSEDDSDYDPAVDGDMRGKISVNIGSLFGGGGAGADEEERLIPKRHNMKKETPEVRKFVELMTKPNDENDIDNQIDEFKALDPKKRKELIEALENKPAPTDSAMQLMFKILTIRVPTETRAMMMSKYQSLQSLDPSTGEYFKLRNWIDKCCSVPFGLYKDFPVRIEDGAAACAPFMEKARKCLDDSVYGQDEAKLQIMQFIASKIANPTGRGLSLLLVGPPGIGKTSLIKGGIAKALDWPFQFISLGGDSDASTYTGHQLVYESSHCGKIVSSLIAAKSMSCIMMFDELDKISQTPKGEEVQNLLVHLTDPVQNDVFEDKYLSGIPIDLSRTMFIFSANDISKIDKILLDRMQVVCLEGYKKKDKLAIAEQFLLPAALKEVALTEKVNISRDVLEYIIEKFTGDETGVREMKRCIEGVVQKINILRMYNNKSLPFYIEDFSLPFVVKKSHVDKFIKAREDPNKPPAGLYI